MLQLWFRELPTPILNSISPEVLRQLLDTNEQICVDLYGKLPEPNKSLMMWLMDLMVDVIDLASINKMSARNLGVYYIVSIYSTNVII